MGTRGPWLHDWTGQDLIQYGRDHVHTGFAAAQERELAVQLVLRCQTRAAAEAGRRMRPQLLRSRPDQPTVSHGLELLG